MNMDESQKECFLSEISEECSKGGNSDVQIMQLQYHESDAIQCEEHPSRVDNSVQYNSVLEKELSKPFCKHTDKFKKQLNTKFTHQHSIAAILSCAPCTGSSMGSERKQYLENCIHTQPTALKACMFQNIDMTVNKFSQKFQVQSSCDLSQIHTDPYYMHVKDGFPNSGSNGMIAAQSHSQSSRYRQSLSNSVPCSHDINVRPLNANLSSFASEPVNFVNNSSNFQCIELNNDIYDSKLDSSQEKFVISIPDTDEKLSSFGSSTDLNIVTSLMKNDTVSKTSSQISLQNSGNSSGISHKSNPHHSKSFEDTKDEKIFLKDDQEIENSVVSFQNRVCPCIEFENCICNKSNEVGSSFSVKEETTNCMHSEQCEGSDIPALGQHNIEDASNLLLREATNMGDNSNTLQMILNCTEKSYKSQNSNDMQQEQNKKGDNSNDSPQEQNKKGGNSNDSLQEQNKKGDNSNDSQQKQNNKGDNYNDSQQKQNNKGDNSNSQQDAESVGCDYMDLKDSKTRETSDEDDHVARSSKIPATYLSLLKSNVKKMFLTLKSKEYDFCNDPNNSKLRNGRGKTLATNSGSKQLVTRSLSTELDRVESSNSDGQTQVAEKMGTSVNIDEDTTKRNNHVKDVNSKSETSTVEGVFPVLLVGNSHQPRTGWPKKGAKKKTWCPHLQTRIGRPRKCKRCQIIEKRSLEEQSSDDSDSVSVPLNNSDHIFTSSNNGSEADKSITCKSVLSTINQPKYVIPWLLDNASESLDVTKPTKVGKALFLTDVVANGNSGIFPVCMVKNGRPLRLDQNAAPEVNATSLKDSTCSTVPEKQVDSTMNILPRKESNPEKIECCISDFDLTKAHANTSIDLNQQITSMDCIVEKKAEVEDSYRHHEVPNQVNDQDHKNFEMDYKIVLNTTDDLDSDGDNQHISTSKSDIDYQITVNGDFDVSSCMSLNENTTTSSDVNLNNNIILDAPINSSMEEEEGRGVEFSIAQMSDNPSYFQSANNQTCANLSLCCKENSNNFSKFSAKQSHHLLSSDSVKLENSHSNCIDQFSPCVCTENGPRTCNDMLQAMESDQSQLMSDMNNCSPGQAMCVSSWLSKQKDKTELDDVKADSVLKSRCSKSDSEFQPKICTVFSLAIEKCLTRGALEGDLNTQHQPEPDDEEPFQQNSEEGLIFNNQCDNVDLNSVKEETDKVIKNSSSEYFTNKYTDHENGDVIPADPCQGTESTASEDISTGNREENSSLYLWMCVICRKQFQYKHAMKSHVRSHSNLVTGGKTTVCSMCPNKVFQNLKGIELHGVLHSMGRPVNGKMYQRRKKEIELKKKQDLEARNLKKASKKEMKWQKKEQKMIEKCKHRKETGRKPKRKLISEKQNVLKTPQAMSLVYTCEECSHVFQYPDVYVDHSNYQKKRCLLCSNIYWKYRKLGIEMMSCDG